MGADRARRSRGGKQPPPGARRPRRRSPVRRGPPKQGANCRFPTRRATVPVLPLLNTAPLPSAGMPAGQAASVSSSAPRDPAGVEPKGSMRAYSSAPRGPAAVCPYCRPIRAETQHARPLRMGWACVSAEPKALAAGPAGPKALAVGPAGPAFRFPSSPEKRRRRPAPARGPAAVCPYRRPIRDETQHAHPLRMGWACVYAEPKALAAGPAGPA